MLALAAPGLAVVAFAPAAAAPAEVSSRIDQATVYPDGATVTRVIETDLPGGDSVLHAADFPPTLDPASLRVEGEAAARLTIGGIDARLPSADRPPPDPTLENAIEALRDERARLDGAIAAATARRRFAERFADQAPAGLGDKGEARPLSEWRAAFAAIEDEVAAAETAIGEARVKQRDIDRRLAQFDARRTANPPRKTDVRIDINAGAATHATLRVTYTVRGAVWAPLYDARLDTGAAGGKAALDLVRRAEIKQNTGEDWVDVQLAVSTARTAKGGNAPDLRPLIARFLELLPDQRPVMAPPPPPAAGLSETLRGNADKKNENPDNMPKPADGIAAEEQDAAADTGGFQVVYRIPGRVSIAAGEGAKSFRIAAAKITPDLVLRAAPAADPTAFLEADFKHAEDAPLLPGPVALYRDGSYVGRGQMALIAKDEDVRLGFGADDSVKIVRSTVRQLDGTAGMFGSSRTERRQFKTSIRNGHDWPVRIIVEDRTPVSETNDIKVEVLPVTTAPTERNSRNRRGVLSWTLDLAPGASKDLVIAWLVRFPADRAVVYTPGQ